MVTPSDAASSIVADGATSAGGNNYTIAAPAAGATVTATFTITNDDAVMKYTIVVDKTKEEVKPEPVTPVESELDGLTIVYFEQKEAVCDNGDASALFDKQNMKSSTEKGRITYNGIEFGECVKMESSTYGYITPTSNCNITVLYDSEKSDPKITIDEETVSLIKSGDAYYYTFEATAGSTIKLSKGNKATSSTYLYAIIFEPISTGIKEVNYLPAVNANKVFKYTKNGIVVIERNGIKYNTLGIRIE